MSDSETEQPKRPDPAAAPVNINIDAETMTAQRLIVALRRAETAEAELARYMAASDLLVKMVQSLRAQLEKS